MKKRFTALLITKNIFKNRFLCGLLLGSLIVPIVVILRTDMFVLPFFNSKLMTYSEEEAQKTANHLTSHFVAFNQDGIMFSDVINENIRDIMEEFVLEKIKLFDSDGKVLFSSNEEDIGKVNGNEYFHLQIAKGDVVSKIVSKGYQTSEGRLVQRDVAEVYVPIVREGQFLGAFELYYDLTERLEELDAMIVDEALLGTGLFLFMVYVLSVIVFRASEAMLEQEAAEVALKSSNQNLEQLVADKVLELKVTQATAIDALAILAEFHDSNTGEHLVKIRKYTELIGLSLLENSPHSAYLHDIGHKDYIKELVMAATLHDVGKTAIPKEVLTKPGKLSEDEFEVMKSHTTIAWSALSSANKIFVDDFGKDSFLALAGSIAHHHHEKWDGSGYPSGLKGEDIPLSARIVALADAYDALRRKRPYKEPWTHEKATEFIVAQVGKHFDPAVVEVFLDNQKGFIEISESAGYLKRDGISMVATLNQGRVALGEA